MRHFEKNQKNWEIDNEKLKALLVKKGPSLEAVMNELADYLTMKPKTSTIKNWVSGRSNPYRSEVISEIADYLGVTPDTILKKTAEKEIEWKRIKSTYGSSVLVSFFIADLLKTLWGVQCNMFDIRRSLKGEYDCNSPVVTAIINLNSIYNRIIGRKNIKKGASQRSKTDIRDLRHLLRFSGIFPFYFYYILKKGTKCDISFCEVFCYLSGFKFANEAFYDLVFFLVNEVRTSKMQRYVNDLQVPCDFTKEDKNKPALFIPNPMQGLWGRIKEFIITKNYEINSGRKVDYRLFSIGGNCSIWRLTFEIKQKIKYGQISALIIQRESIERSEWLCELIDCTIEKCKIPLIKT